MTQRAPPDPAADLFAAGNALAARGDYAGALACYEKVAALRPADPMVQTNIGAALARLRRPEEAVAAYRRAIAIDPALHLALNNLGNALRDLGRFAEAQDCYRSAIALAPTKGAYYRNLVRSKPLAADDPLLIAMEHLVQAAVPLPTEDRISLHFALGQALAAVGRNEPAFHHLQEGNALHRTRLAYDEAATLGVFDRIRAIFTEALMRERRGSGDPSPTPVFIVGMPRSGSTLIEQILASHPGVFGAGERADFTRAVAQLVRQSGAAGSDLAAIASLSPERLGQLGADYCRRLEEGAGVPGVYRRITDKYPFNFVYLGLIHLALPNARIIHSRRAAVETCLSCFSHLFEDVPFSYDLGELGRYYRAYDALMDHWRAVLPPGVMIEVRYEALVADVEGETRRMLAHCGLEWQDSCLAFHETRRVVATESAAQVRRPIYRTALTRWRPAPERLQPLLDGLGPAL